MRSFALWVGGVVEGSLLTDLQNLAFPTPVDELGSNGGEKLADEGPEATVLPREQNLLYYPSLEEMDLQCTNGTHAGTWNVIQQKMRYIFGPDAAFQSLDKQGQIEPVLYSIIEDMASIGHVAEDGCGVGKVLVQLLSVLAADTDGSTVRDQILSNERLTSPLMTLLLDIPWIGVQPMWPMFGFFAQLQQRRILNETNSLVVDGLEHPDVQKVAGGLSTAIMNGDTEGLKVLSQAFLDAGAGGVELSPIGFLTSIFTQAAIANSTEEAQAIFFEAQNVVKRMVFQPQDLDTLLASRWPLWGLAHIASIVTG